MELEAATERTGDPPTTSQELAAYNYELARAYRNALTRLDGIEPPPEAAAHAAKYRSYAAEAAEVFTATAEAWLAGGPPEDGGERMAAVTAASQELTAMFEELLDGVLEAATDPLTRYLRATIPIRREFAAAYTDAIESMQPLIEQGDGPVIADALTRHAASFDGYLATWDGLDPPPQASEIHETQRTLIVTISQIFTDLAGPVAAEDAATTRAVASRMTGFVADVGAATLEWNRLLITALRAIG